MHAIRRLTGERDEALKKMSRLDVTCDTCQNRLGIAERRIDELQKAIVCLPVSQLSRPLIWGFAGL